ncbi:two-component system regulatory protein YycI [Bacillus solitudinis]|uniref:two-component system regulatory protein YycI n=1 Tax=Bacillus solitudinis TaxID=2014074 RepID=UPI000C23BE0D|nr:two-component system regulatory protein YycI [Bacillus solitudinis]
MNWSRTKTIFIITFLMLNVFLVLQLIDKNTANQISLITEATIQERLRENNVTIESELTEEDLSGVLVVGKYMEFAEDYVDQLIDQEARIIEGTTILSILEEPYVLSEEQFTDDLTKFLERYIPEGADYRFGRYNQDNNQILLYQKYGDKTAYTLGDEPLVLQLDEKNQIRGYQQRYFEFEEQPGREREMYSSLKAVEILLNDQLLKMNVTISDIEFGYYSFFSPQGDVQVFAPMWRVTVEEDVFLVNAIDGSIQHLT